MTTPSGFLRPLAGIALVAALACGGNATESKGTDSSGGTATATDGLSGATGGTGSGSGHSDSGGTQGVDPCPAVANAKRVMMIELGTLMLDPSGFTRVDGTCAAVLGGVTGFFRKVSLMCEDLDGMPFELSIDLLSDRVPALAIPEGTTSDVRIAVSQGSGADDTPSVWLELSATIGGDLLLAGADALSGPDPSTVAPSGTPPVYQVVTVEQVTGTCADDELPGTQCGSYSRFSLDATLGDADVTLISGQDDALGPRHQFVLGQAIQPADFQPGCPPGGWSWVVARTSE